MTKKDKDAEKEHKKLHQIYKAGEKYHCGECGSEVHFGNDCPTCNKKIDWAQVQVMLRR
jgi:rubrerythrin